MMMIIIVAGVSLCVSTCCVCIRVLATRAEFRCALVLRGESSMYTPYVYIYIYIYIYKPYMYKLFHYKQSIHAYTYMYIYICMYVYKYTYIYIDISGPGTPRRT